MPETTGRYIIGLDFGSESARGVLLDSADGVEVATHVHPYRHGILDQSLPDGTPLAPRWALQDADDYIEAATAILEKLGRGRDIAGIGVDFTASSPLPVTADGTPLSRRHAGQPHAYVKLYKHQAAQPEADAINAVHGHRFTDFGGRISGEWLLAKAVQLAKEAPAIWRETARFIEAGDWLVWQLTGVEARSRDFAAYKAQHDPASGYPADILDGLAERLTPPQPTGSAAGSLCADWRARTGIGGTATVAVAVIDSHAALPAIGAVRDGTLVAALGTSAAYLMLGESERPLPPGLEGRARDAALPGLWCYEAGQPSFGDCLGWFVRAFGGTEAGGTATADAFASLTEAAAAIAPAEARLVALDWWNGNRVPHADASLTGLILGLTRRSGKAEIYRALMESLCFGARHIADLIADGGIPLHRVIVTSGLAERSPVLLQMMADVLERPISVPDIRNVTAVGAAIHGAVAAGVVADFREGAERFGARRARDFTPTRQRPPPTASATRSTACSRPTRRCAPPCSSCRHRTDGAGFERIKGRTHPWISPENASSSPAPARASAIPPPTCWPPAAQPSSRCRARPPIWTG